LQTSKSHPDDKNQNSHPSDDLC